MGFRFRKSIGLGKFVRLNIGKKGVGISAGVRGARIGVGSRGVYTSVGIPGTGVSSMSYHNSAINTSTVNKIQSSSVNGNQPSNNKLMLERYSDSLGCFSVIAILLILVLAAVSSWKAVVYSVVIFAGIYFVWVNSAGRKSGVKYNRAFQLYEQKKYDQAVVLLSDAVKLNPNSVRIVFLNVFSLMQLGRFQESLAGLLSIKNAGSYKAQRDILTANCYMKLKQYDEAVTIFQEYLERFPDDIHLILLLGNVFYEQQKYDLAIETYKKAPILKRNIDDPLVAIHYQLGLSYKAINDKKNAIKHFNKVYSHDMRYKDIVTQINELASAKM